MFILYAFLIAVGGTVPYLYFGDPHSRIPIRGIIVAFIANLIVALLIGYAILPFLYGLFGGPIIVITILVSGLANSLFLGLIKKRFTRDRMIYAIFLAIMLIKLIAESSMFHTDGCREIINTVDDQALASPDGLSVALTNEANFETAVLELTRVSTEVVGTKTLYHLYSKNMPDRVFVATSDISPELPISQPLDVVKVGYFKTNEPLVQLVTFNNTKLNIRTATEQQMLTEQREQP